MKRFSQLLAIAALTLTSLAQAQSSDPGKPSKSAPRLDDLTPSAPIRWSTRPEKTPQTPAPTPDTVTEQGTQTAPPLLPKTEVGATLSLLPRLDTERPLPSGGFPRNRLEFEQQFGLTKDYANPLQQNLSQWFYRANDLIFTWYGGFRQWQQDFDNTVNQTIFGRSLPASRDTEFWGQPRFKTKLEPTGATFRIDVPFGK